MNNPLQPPLILIADDTGSEIAHRVANCLKVLGSEPRGNVPDFTQVGGFELPLVDIKWSQSPNAADYLALAGRRRTLVIMDVAWAGINETQGLGIAQSLLADPDFASRSIILLKSTEKAGRAAAWAEPLNLALRQLRVSQSVRLRLLAADRTVDGETIRYEQGIISQALLDLQEEAIFDAMNRGEWSAADVGKAIDQIVAADFYGAFSGDKALGKLYSLRVLRRYHQRLSASYPQGPLNIGIAHLIGDKTRLPSTLQQVACNLTARRDARESAAIVSALLDYGEVASAERLLFALPLKDNTETEIKTDFDEQTWKPDKIASANAIKRRCDLSGARKALNELCTALQSCGQDKLAPVAALKDALHPNRIPDILESNRLIAEMRSAVLMDLPAAIAELVESLLNDIERAVVEGVLPDFDGISELRSAQAPELITLDLDFMDADKLERIKPERKRVRLLNRRLFEHPAPEAARILSAAQSSPEGIVLALRTYIQSPEAIAALVGLLSTAPQSFSQCVATLSETDADIRLPSSFAAFDKLWRDHWKGKSTPAVLKFLQEHGFSGTDFGQQIREWNNSDAGRLSPIEPPKVSLLELLTAHLAILEYRIRSFGIIIAHAVTSDWKVAASANLAELWRGRGWNQIFSATSVADSERRSYLPELEWTGQMLNALLTHPQAKSCYDGFRQFLMDYEVRVGRDETTGKPALFYKSALPAWLRVGNLALPLIVIRRNLMDRHISIPEQKHRGGDIEALQDNDAAADPRSQSDDAEEAEFVSRCRSGDQSACDVLMDEFDWPAEKVRRLRLGR